MQPIIDEIMVSKPSVQKDLVHVLPSGISALDIIRGIVQSGLEEGPFYVLDVEDILNKHVEWKTKMPRVKPFYAVKCNDSPMVLAVLAALGASFDCASQAEITTVLDLGVDRSRIIFANPTKIPSQIRFAAANNIDFITFDNKTELYKMKKFFPSAKMLLRIRSDAQCRHTLGSKFGCDVETEAKSLLQLAVELGIDVIGVSFHVGTGCVEPLAYRRAISDARSVFDLGLALGLPMKLLDLGGGFPGHAGHSLYLQIAEIVNAALEELFPESSGVQVIAEPGRFYVASAYTLATLIHSRRDTMYYINDGVYGSFNSVISSSDVFIPKPLFDGEAVPQEESTVWGPTLDSVDLVWAGGSLPRLDVGDWLVFHDMGAYTVNFATSFNGFTPPRVYTIAAEDVWQSLKDPLEQLKHMISFKMHI